LFHSRVIQIAAATLILSGLACNASASLHPVVIINPTPLPQPGQNQPVPSQTDEETSATMLPPNTIDVVNQGSVDICFVYEWTGASQGPNLLTGGPIPPGSTTQLSTTPYFHEFIAEDCNHQRLSDTEVHFSPQAVWIITDLFPTPIPITYTFYNDTDQTICRIMAGPPNTDGGSDILNGGWTSMGTDPTQPTPIPVITIPPGGSVNVTTSKGDRLTFEAFACGVDSEIDTLRDVEVTEDFEWHIGE